MVNTITVTDSATNLQLIDNFGTYSVWLQNDGATALDSCSIQGRNSEDAAWVTIVGTTEQWQTATTFLIATNDSIDPSTLAGAGEWNGAIYNTSFKYLKFVASVASGSTTVNLEVTNVGNL